MAHSYKDAVGIWTIGYGSTDHVVEGQTITEAEADKRLRLTLAVIAECVTEDVKVPLTQRQFDALCDFEYNLGRSALDHSTLLILLNLGRYEQAAQQFSRWCHAGDKVLPGLLKRRLTEQSWFTSKTQGQS